MKKDQCGLSLGWELKALETHCCRGQDESFSVSLKLSSPCPLLATLKAISRWTKGSPLALVPQNTHFFGLHVSHGPINALLSLPNKSWLVR
ncbi:hypothetical protein LOK49_LG02G01559 [Camellia lanceoleosa]|uniref:Uncharacterized protein n=1 Tax=Camellia lanceoleosa TaxID=1840588 RepID=A0ACC0IJ69_9ERIC|nr:hypothetical protein LOK49_LG02G01559 [Camellia lanceoleosa]